MLSWERIHGVRVFYAGKGEWYNQPHDKRWDMGEDVQPLQPPSWHIELEQACQALEDRQRHIVIDLSEMDWLVGNDWGFLIRLSRELAPEGIKPIVIVRGRVSGAADLIGVHEYMKIVKSLEEAF